MNTISQYHWSRYGGYECSSAGDRRFSAFNAIMPDGRTIEEHYQCDVKGYDIGGRNWRLGKGKPPLKPMSKDEQWTAYLALWQTWAKMNPAMIDDLRSAIAATQEPCSTGLLSDRFASTPINQARALAHVLNHLSA